MVRSVKKGMVATDAVSAMTATYTGSEPCCTNEVTRRDTAKMPWSAWSALFAPNGLGAAASVRADCDLVMSSVAVATPAMSTPIEIRNAVVMPGHRRSS